MGRPLRIQFDGAWYHVMNRGLERRAIVRDDRDRRLFFDILGDTVQTYQLEVHAFSLLDNHYHLLLHTPKGGVLPSAMRHLNAVYTRSFNKRARRDGPLFRGRYKSILVDRNEYLLELVRYIHLNPVEAGICVHPARHRWTSHRSYLNDSLSPVWLSRHEVLGRFSSRPNKAKRQLDEFVCAGIPKEFRQQMDQGRVYLGQKGFGEWVYKNFMDIKGAGKGLAQGDIRPKSKVRLRHVLEQVAFAYNVPLSQLRRVQSGKKNEARSAAIYLSRRLTGMKQDELAGWFHARNGYTLAKSQQRMREEMAKNRKVNRKIHLLENSILSTVKP